MIYKLKIGYQRYVIPEICEQIDLFEGVVNNLVNSIHIFYTGKAFQNLKEIWDYMFFETQGFMEAVIIKISYATFYGAEAFKALEEIINGKSPWKLRDKYNVTFIPED